MNYKNVSLNFIPSSKLNIVISLPTVKNRSIHHPFTFSFPSIWHSFSWTIHLSSSKLHPSIEEESRNLTDKNISNIHPLPTLCDAALPRSQSLFHQILLLEVHYRKTHIRHSLSLSNPHLNQMPQELSPIKEPIISRRDAEKSKVFLPAHVAMSTPPKNIMFFLSHSNKLLCSRRSWPIVSLHDCSGKTLAFGHSNFGFHDINPRNVTRYSLR